MGFTSPVMRTWYKPPPREGDSKATRTGIPPPKLKLPSELPFPAGKNIMDLGLHLKEVRERARGMTPEEREWRRKWILDQKLHPDEPIRVEACYRQLNPIRRLYRYPLDKLYETVLEPRWGWYKAHIARTFAPKFIIGYIFGCAVWYHVKYSTKDWTHMLGSYVIVPEQPLARREEIERDHPGLIEKALEPPKTIQDYGDEKFSKRISYLTLGKSERPW